MQCNRRRSESSRVDGFVAGVIRDALGVGIDVGHQLVASDGLLAAADTGRSRPAALRCSRKQLLGVFSSSPCSSFWTSSSAAAAVGVGAVHHRCCRRDTGCVTSDRAIRPKPVAHAVLRDHLAGQLRRALDVVGTRRSSAMPKTTCSAARPPSRVCSSTMSSSLLD